MSIIEKIFYSSIFYKVRQKYYIEAYNQGRYDEMANHEFLNEFRDAYKEESKLEH